MIRKFLPCVVLGIGALLCSGPSSPASTTLRRVASPETEADNVDTFHNIRDALMTAPALASGAVIEILPGAAPQRLSGQNFNVSGLVVRGAAGVDASDQPTLALGGASTISAANVRFERLNLQFESGATLQVNGSSFTLTKSQVFDPGGTGTLLLDGIGTTLSSNTILISNTTISGQPSIKVQTATLTTFRDNDFFHIGPGVLVFLSYTVAGAKNDLIEGNRFFGPASMLGAAPLASLIEAVSDVVVRDNYFSDPGFATVGLSVRGGSQNILVEGNTFEMSTTLGQFSIASGAAGAATSVTVRGNEFVGDSTTLGLTISLASSGTQTLVIEGNRFRTGIGMRLGSAGAGVAGCDAGLGASSSLGANDFSAYTAAATSGAGAIVTAAPTVGTSATALGNLFGGDPETVIFDKDDSGTLINVNATTALAGDQAYVALLYARFLRRPADLSNTSSGGAGVLVTKLANGASPKAIAKKVILSEEALGRVIDGHYRAILGRSPSETERHAGFLFLTQQGKLEENLITSLYTRKEAGVRYSRTVDFVHAIFAGLLGRAPSDDELSQFVRVAKTSRADAVNLLLAKGEYKSIRVAEVFDDLLDRAPTGAELTAFRSLDRLNLQIELVRKRRAGL